MAYDYDVVTIGAGAAGLTAAGIAGSLGAKTLLVEKDRFGGDCTWTGCVPSKTLLAQAKEIDTAARHTTKSRQELVDFSQIMERVRSVQQDIYAEADSPEVLQKFNVDTRKATATFADTHTIKLTDGSETTTVTARFIFIATGASPFVPAITGIEDVSYETSDTLFSRDAKPQSLAIIGGGPIGVEMGQAFNRLGTDVTVIESSNQILSQSDSELSSDLESRLSQEGVTFMKGSRVESVREKAGTCTVRTASDKTLTADTLLLATGRRPNVSGLGLGNAGVTFQSDGIHTNKYGQTNRSHIYAIGDVTNGPRFTHQSEQEAKTSVFRALYKLPLSSKNPIPRVTYTDPELAEVGKSSQQLKKDGVGFDTYTFPYAKLDRAITEGDTRGEIRAFTKPGSGKILGAAVLGSRAGELISEFALAMENGISLQDIARTVHPYPSYGLGVRRLADQYMVQNQPHWLLSVAKSIFGYRGSIFTPKKDDIL